MNLILKLTFCLIATFAAELPAQEDSPASSSDSIKRVVVLHSYLLSDAKRQLLTMKAEGRSLSIEFADQAPPQFELLATDLVIVDIGHTTVGDSLIDIVKQAVEPTDARYIIVDDNNIVAGDDGDSVAAFNETRGIAEKNAMRIRRYYRYAGEKNIDRLMERIAAGNLEDETIPMPDVVNWPEQGFYHPAWSEIALDAETTLKGLEEQVQESNAEGIVAIAINANTLTSADTFWVDRLIQELEQKGIVAYAFYGPRQAEDLFGRMTQVDGKVFPAVLINAAVVFRPQQRAAEIDSLGIPVLQLVPSLDQSQEQWRESAAGLPLENLAYYYSSSELAGMIDPVLGIAKDSQTGQMQPIEEQIRLIADKAASIIRLQSLENAQKRIGVFVYNYPRGAKHFGASFLNVPRSLTNVLAAMRDAGYQTEALEETPLIARLQESLDALYGDDLLAAISDDDACGTLSLEAYEDWFGSLPSDVRKSIVDAWGLPSEAVVENRGFVIPLVRLGNVIVLPQPLRYPQHGADSFEVRRQQVSHRSNIPLNHQYLATYLYLRTKWNCDAIIHLGTHGTVEWAPGKQRALSAWDDPYLVMGHVPHFYPYIMDNLGEATTAKRRGRAVTISHMTPLARPAGFRPGLHEMHDRMHDWEVTTAPAVRDELKRQLIEDFVEHQIDLDLGWSTERIAEHFEEFMEVLHPYLDSIAMAAQPQGLAVFGEVPPPHRRLAMVMQMLQKPLIEALGEDIDEVFLLDGPLVVQSRPARWLELALQDPVAASRIDLRAVEAMKGESESNVPNRSASRSLDSEELLGLARRAQELYRQLSTNSEIDALLSGLDGKHIPAAYGGDPVRDPTALPTGRNLYGFDPMRVPTESAWNIGKGVFQQWWNEQIEAGRAPEHLAYSLWAGETMRHQGVMEAQVFAALGVQPIWDDRGRIQGLSLIPSSELGRPRLDVTCTVTGSYRDQFPHVIAWINRAVAMVAALDSEDDGENFTRLHARELASSLEAEGISADEAQRLSLLRVFSGDRGVYGTGLETAVLFTDLWSDAKKGGGDQELASLFIDRMGWAYDENLQCVQAQALLRQQLASVDVAMMSRSSSTYGVLTSDDAFAYLGGLSLAARAVGNDSVRLQVQNLRDLEEVIVDDGRMAIAKEMQSRYLHPGWIAAQQAEGYSGTLQALKAAQFLWGWNVTEPTSVREDQWQSMYDVYIADMYDLKLAAWFDQHNPAAKAQFLERMVDAMRLGYWTADNATQQLVLASYRDALEKTETAVDSPAVAEWTREQTAKLVAADPKVTTVESLEQMDSTSSPTTATASEVQASVPQIVSGQELIEQAPVQDLDLAPRPRFIWMVGAVLISVFIAGGLAEIFRQQRKRS